MNKQNTSDGFHIIFSAIFVVILVGSAIGLLNYLEISSADTAYLQSDISGVCPGVPELTYLNTTFFEETRVHECSFLGYCNDNIDKHKTVEKMKQRCAELQRDLP